jgi:Zn-dependent membrane protease YugP
VLAPAIFLGLWANFRVKSAYAKAGEIRASSGLSGAETARMILQAHDIRDVNVEETGGMLTDHYDSRHKVLRLSPEVFQGRTVAALGIAAHEAGHAIQDKVHYAPLKLRNGIVPLAAIGGQLWIIPIMIGFMLGAATTVIGTWFIWAGIAMLSTIVLFQLINLPVEFNASSRAKDLLQSTGMIASGDEARAMNRVLNAAALTYVAATLSAVLTLVYYVMRSGVLDRRN